MLKLIFGHSKSGKSTRIYQLMKEDAASGKRSFLIVPEQQTVQCEQKLLELLPPSAQLSCEVLNFSRLANLVFRHYGGLSYNYADKGCKALIMWKNLRELAPMLSEYGNAAEGKRCMALTSEMLAAVSELKAYCISPLKLEKAAEELEASPILKNKLLDLSLIMSAYTASLSESYSDAADDLSKLAEKLEGRDFFKGVNVYIDSFSSFTAQEYAVIKQILKGADRTVISVTLDSLATGQIHYESTADTAFRIMSLAKDLSVSVEEEKLSGHFTSSEVLAVIAESLWSPDVSNINVANVSNDINIIRAADPYEEAEAAANIVRRLIMDGMRCKDIAIIARDASLYRGILDATLEKAQIPYFFSQSTEMLSKPPIKFLFSALRIKMYNWRTEDVISYLKTGLCDADTQSIDLFECYSSVWKLRASDYFGGDWTMNPDGYSSALTERGKSILEKINALRECFVPALSRLFAALDASKNVEDMCRAMYSFMEENRLSEKLTLKAEQEYAKGRRREAAEMVQLYNSSVKALENIALALSDSECTVFDFYDALRLMLDSTVINTIPTARDQVTVGSASILRTDGIKCAILIGLNEGEFPQNISENGVFSDSDKKLLSELDISLSGDMSMRSSEELFYAYRAMTAPSERLFLLSHESDLSGAFSPPSSALERIKKLFPELKVKNYSSLPIIDTVLAPEFALEKLPLIKNEPLGQAIRNYTESIDALRGRIALSEIPPENTFCSITQESSDAPLRLTQTLIDNYVACPFEYMCNRILKLSDIRSAEFDYSNFGTYIHYIFENYLRRAKEDSMIGLPPDPDYISRVIEETAAEYILRSFGGGEADSPRLNYRFFRMRRLAQLVATGITREFEDSSFRPEFFELSVGRPFGSVSLAPLVFPTDCGRDVSLSGKIDRVDIWKRESDGKVFVRVVDYKSGKKVFSPQNIENGEGIQLPLYLFALCDKEQSGFSKLLGATELIPAGAMYLSSLIPPIDAGKDTDVLQAAEKSIVRSGFISGDIELLNNISHSMSKQYLCGASVDKSGKASGRSLISEDEMASFKESLKNTVVRIANSIISGNMDCSPSFSDGVCHCERCRMKAVCRSAAKFFK